MDRRNTLPAVMESLDIPENFTRLRFTSDSVGKIYNYRQPVCLVQC